jgi:predicted SprT family Zn-dependent metalloprotease
VQRDQLIERRDGFNDDYRMKCHSSRSSFLSARDHADEINQAHMDCEHCGTDIHFGRAAIAI